MKIYLYVFCNKKFFLKLKIKFRGRLFLPRVCTDTQQSDKVMSMRRNHVAMYFYNLCKRWFSKSGDSNTFRASQLLRAIYSGSLDMMYWLFLAAYLAIQPFHPFGMTLSWQPSTRKSPGTYLKEKSKSF